MSTNQSILENVLLSHCLMMKLSDDERIAFQLAIKIRIPQQFSGRDKNLCPNGFIKFSAKTSSAESAYVTRGIR